MSPTPRLLIPDFSEWQGTSVDWKTLVHGGYPAAIIRAYNGQRADHQFAHNRDQAHKAGIRALGIYAYLVSDVDVEHQAQAFVSLVGTLRAGEWPILDYEDGDLHPSAIARWMTHVAAGLHGDAKPWLYTGEYLYRSEHLQRAAVPATRTWLAAYSAHEPAEGHALWQYTDHMAGLPGLGGHAVDCSVFHGDIVDLLALTHAGEPPLPAPVQGPTAHARHPFPHGLHPGGSTPSAIPLQRALKATGWMDHDVPESDHYGPKTENGVGGFNRKHGLNSHGVRWDTKIGPHGWALLMTLAYGSG